MRYLLLAEGLSANPVYGKTMRGVLRYRREDVVVASEQFGGELKHPREVFLGQAEDGEDDMERESDRHLFHEVT